MTALTVIAVFSLIFLTVWIWWVEYNRPWTAFTRYQRLA